MLFFKFLKCSYQRLFFSIFVIKPHNHANLHDFYCECMATDHIGRPLAWYNVKQYNVLCILVKAHQSQLHALMGVLVLLVLLIYH